VPGGPAGPGVPVPPEEFTGLDPLFGVCGPGVPAVPEDDDDAFWPVSA
jgi:hypothetical protein